MHLCVEPYTSGRMPVAHAVQGMEWSSCGQRCVELYSPVGGGQWLLLPRQLVAVGRHG